LSASLTLSSESLLLSMQGISWRSRWREFCERQGHLFADEWEAAAFFETHYGREPIVWDDTRYPDIAVCYCPYED
jgi:hypothetical protein